MPTFYAPGKRRGNTGWVVRGRIAGCGEREIRTCETNKKAAATVWRRFVADIEAEATKADDIERRPECATVSDAIALYKKRRIPPKQTEIRLDRLSVHMGAVLLSAVTQVDIEIAARKMYPHQKPQTLNSYVIGPMRSALHCAAAAKMMPYMRLSEYKPVGVVRKVTRPADALAIAECCPEPASSIIFVLAMTGWRLGEVLSLRREWFDFARCQVRRWIPKLQEWEEVAVLPEVCSRIAAQPVRKDGMVFRCSKWNLYRTLDRYGFRHYRPHQSRRGAATALHESGASAREIADAVGWRHVGTVQTYIRTNSEHVRETLGKLKTAGKPAGKAPESEGNPWC